MQERRKAERINLTEVAEIEPNNKASDIQAMTKNVSQSGVCICSDTYLEPGKFTKVKIHKENQIFPESKWAVVAWAKLVKDQFGSLYQIGLSSPD